MANREQVLAAIDNLSVYRQGDSRAPHKPLLLLLALAHLRRDGARQFSFGDIADELGPLLERFAPQVKGEHEPHRPYWHLQSDGLWQVAGAEELPLNRNGFPLIAALRRTSGGLPAELADLLVADPALGDEIAQRLLDGHFPQSRHAGVLEAVGLAMSQTDRPISELVAALIPVPSERSKILSALAESVAVAAEQAPGGWGLTARPDFIRLNVGKIEVFTVVKTGVGVGFDLELRDTLPPELRGSGTNAYSSVPNSTRIEVAQNAFGEAFEKLRGAHHSLISQSAATRDGGGAGYSHKNAHAPEMLQYLSQAVGRELPSPRYEVEERDTAVGVWKYGLKYRNKGTPDAGDDQFMRWINTASRGIRNSGGIRFPRELDSSARLPLGVPPIIILTTRAEHVSSNASNPWKDRFDKTGEHLDYWGDAKTEHGGDLTKALGNGMLRRVREAIREHGRSIIPPVLHFTVVEKGWVRFNGLWRIDEIEDAHDDEADVPNLRLRMTRIATEVDSRWIRARLEATTPDQLDRFAPPEWIARGRAASKPREAFPRPTADEQELEQQVAELLMGGMPIQHPLGQLKPRAVMLPGKLSYERDASVKGWVLQEAHGACELCGKQAPFVRQTGEPFLEVHHLRRLADGGADTTENAVAVCPNCHRQLHYGEDAAAITRRLTEEVRARRRLQGESARKPRRSL